MRYLLLTLSLFISTQLFAGLKAYVEKPDDSYAFEVVKDETTGTTRTRMIHMTSQTWDGKPWKHWIYLAAPAEIQHPEKAILIIVGGSNRDEMPKLPKEIQVIAGAVGQLGVPVAVVSQIPNQPLFGNLKEDNIIALTRTAFF